MQNLLQIFKEESEFTLQELEKIASERGEEIDLVEQFWINSDIFRTNLSLIVKTMSRRFPFFQRVGFWAVD